MGAVAYYLVLPFIYLISLLPFPLLYLLSDFLYVIIYYVAGYRKQVVMQNLRNSFPEKSEQELKRLCKDFFYYLCDIMLESLKPLTISKKAIIARCKFDPKSLALLQKLAEDNRSIIMVMGHFGNWEWSGHPYSLLLKYQLVVLYHPLGNKYYDGLMLKMRERNGTKMIPMKTAFKEMLARRNELTTTVFIADQTAQPDNAYWTTFLNQDTAVFKGTEVIARKLNQPVVYAAVKRVKRGYYEMYAEMLCEHPQTTADGEISEMHTRRLERDIIAQPEIWLWSHRRWKHKRPVTQ